MPPQEITLSDSGPESTLSETSCGESIEGIIKYLKLIATGEVIGPKTHKVRECIQIDIIRYNGIECIHATYLAGSAQYDISVVTRVAFPLHYGVCVAPAEGDLAGEQSYGPLVHVPVVK